MIKKVTITLFHFVVFVLAHTVSAQTTLYVKEKSGQQSAYLINDVRSLTFPNGNLFITYVNGTSKSFALNNISRLSFREEQFFCEANYVFTIDSITRTFSALNQTIGKNSYYWLFGDGSYSNEVAPIHKYDKDGIYRISLTATDTVTGCQARVTKEVIIKSTVIEPCRADFSVTIDTASLSLQCVNKSSINVDNFYWEFGDGALSNAVAPMHTYASEGYYLVKLNVLDTNSGCFDSKFMLIALQDIQKPCRADFTYNVDIQTQKIFFANKSEAPASTKYLWDFNDGYLSTLSNPTHQYDLGGYYDVCLNIVNLAAGCKNTYCEILQASDKLDFCQAEFAYTVDTTNGDVQFIDISKGKHNGWEWDFGNGFKMNTKNGKYKYAPGFYTVTLKITDSETGCVSYFVDVINVKQEKKLKAGFAFDKKEKQAKGVMPVEFQGASYGDVSEMEWDFGDGESNSSSMSPTHDYQQEGIYTACFTVTNLFTGNSDKICQQVVLITTGQQENTDAIRFFPNPASDYVNLFVSDIPTGQQIEYKIYGMLGQRLVSGTIPIQNEMAQIHVKNLMPGIYMLEINSARTTAITKLIIK